MAMNSTERLRETPLFPVQRQHGDKTSTPQACTNVVLCWFSGVMFLAGFPCYSTVSFLANCGAFIQTEILSGTRNWASSNPHIALSLQRVVLFREGCP